jgi:hypothetical protein
MPRWITRITVAVAVVVGASLAIASSDGPNTRLTGAPAIGSIGAEGTCQNCHGGNALNSGGSIELLDAPTLYSVGRTYTVRVRLSSTQTAAQTSRLWGIEMTAVRMSDGQGTGTFANIAGQGTTIANGSGSYATRQYVAQAAAGLHSGAASPAEWQVQWTAPATGVGAIAFYLAGLAANGNGNTSGDWVYTTSFAAQDTTTPTRTLTWAQVKDHYRRH